MAMPSAESKAHLMRFYGGILLDLFLVMKINDKVDGRELLVSLPISYAIIGWYTNTLLTSTYLLLFGGRTTPLAD